MLEYDNPILHTNLWEELDNQPWKPLVESKDKWKDHDYIAVSNTNAFKSGYTLREFTNYSQFLNALRPEVVAKASFPLELSIGFVNEKTLDKVEFVVNFDDPKNAKLEVTTSQAMLYNKLKTSYKYGYDKPTLGRDTEEDQGIQKVTRSPESDPKKQNTLTWNEKTVKSSLPTAKCHELCKKAIDKLRIKHFREIKKDENLWNLIKKNETYKNCVVDMQKFNEVFYSTISSNRINESEEEYIADDPDFAVPGKAIDFDNFQSFLKFIHPSNLSDFLNDSDFPLDVYIQFASHENARVACMWIAYSSKPEDRVKNAKITLFSAVPYIYKRISSNKQRIVIKTIGGKRDILAVIQSDDMYIDFNITRKHYNTTAKDAYWTVRGMIMRLMSSNFAVFPDGTDIIEFVTEKPELSTRPIIDKSKLKSDGRPKAGGRPKGSTKKKEW